MCVSAARPPPYLISASVQHQEGEKKERQAAVHCLLAWNLLSSKSGKLAKKKPHSGAERKLISAEAAWSE